MGELLEWFLEPENRNACRIVGLFCIIIPLIFFYGGYPQGADAQGIIFSRGWFREIFEVAMILMSMVGVLLTWAGFTRRKGKEL
jgi:hypothetical protein